MPLLIVMKLFVYSSIMFQVIGKWFKRLEMKASDVMWGSNIGTFGSSFLPTSRCSEPCGPGEVKKMTEVH